MSLNNEREAMDTDVEMSTTMQSAQPLLPTTEPSVSEKQAGLRAPGLHPVFYIAAWITLSSSTILFNKHILSSAGFGYPIILTTWHLTFATVSMTRRIYVQKIVPIGLMFSLSLICGNQAYLFLSVSFIQMLKATMPVVTLLIGWAFHVSSPSLTTLGNITGIVVGVVIASIGEVKFNIIGFAFQAGGILFEAVRLVIVEQLLSGSGSDTKMDPLVSLYYFAPVCAIMNAIIAYFTELPRITLTEIQNLGLFVLLLNGVVTFLLNVSSVMLIGRTSSLVMTLCGVLKDILLVGSSMVIFGDPVTGLQAFGYTVAICGLLYYKLGGEKLQELFGSMRG